MSVEVPFKVPQRLDTGPETKVSGLLCGQRGCCLCCCSRTWPQRMGSHLGFICERFRARGTVPQATRGVEDRPERENEFTALATECTVDATMSGRRRSHPVLTRTFSRNYFYCFCEFQKVRCEPISLSPCSHYIFR